MEIIKGTMNELKDIVRLALMLWPNDYNEEQFNVHFKKLLNNEDAMIFLAKEQNEYVGFAHCQLRYDYVEGTETTPVGYLESIYVMEKHRKKGIGKALVDYCEIRKKHRVHLCFYLFYNIAIKYLTKIQYVIIVIRIEIFLNISIQHSRFHSLLINHFALKVQFTVFNNRSGDTLSIY